MAYLGKTREPGFLFNATPETIGFAKNLRKKMTVCEKILWKRLKNKNIRGVKFRRQHPIGYYIADFYCHEAHLVIEVDGPIHSNMVRKEHDENRTAELDRLGIRVIRFTNQDIKTRIGWVLQTIRQTVIECLKNERNPSDC